MANLCVATPTLTVRDNRGLDVRTLRYNRNAAGTIATQYVDAQTHNILGQPAASQDPRFFGSATLNFQHTPALSGQVLQSVSVDAGTANACADIAGRPIWQYSQGRDANLPSDKNITVQLSYDALRRAVQRACYTVNVSGGGSLGGPTDIWSYGDYSGSPGATYDSSDTTDARNANQRGQELRHFDTAGLIDMSVLGYAVQGTALREDRRFMATACDVNTHWQPGSPQALYGLNKQRLELDTDPANLYSTQWTYSALGQILTQADAKGHQQQTAYDCAGRKYTASVTPKGGTYTPVCAGITYTAAGAIDTRSDANNIQVAYAYEPQTTQRLISITALRTTVPSSAAKKSRKEQLAGKDRKSILAKSVFASDKPMRASTTAVQTLAYTYDGVGNVIALSDSSASAQVSFFRNRAVTPDRGYAYDALYQLAGATGRENYVNDTPKGTDWPGGGQFSPSSAPDYRPYTRTYTYDLGGNLTTIRSSNWSGAAPPTRELVVGESSNRAVCTANNAGLTQANIDTYFDRAGKSICLDANRTRPMYWTAFHQLYCVVTAYRTPTDSSADWSASDREQYAYDGDGQRVRKYASSMAGNTWNHADTRYLPGLELRNDTASGEDIEVIVLDDGARVLNWVGGAGKPNDIPNLQLRYQYSDRQNSCQIETDSAGNVITQEEYYPYGGTAVLASRSDSEVKYKYIRYSGKERDATGLYYYGLRYYQPWIGRWVNPDPAGTVDGQNLYCMVRNNPVTLQDRSGSMADSPEQAQAQVQPGLPLIPQVLIAPKSKEVRLFEAGLVWRKNGVLKDGESGAIVDASDQGDDLAQFTHTFDQESEQGGEADQKRRFKTRHSRMRGLGLTWARSQLGGTNVTSYEPRGVELPSGEVVRPTLAEFLFEIAPVVTQNRHVGKKNNNYENVVKYLYHDRRRGRELARKMTVDLAAVRIVQFAGLERGSNRSTAETLWKTAKERVADVLIKRIKEREFYEGQEELGGLIADDKKKETLLGSLPWLSKLKGAAPASSSEPGHSGNQNANAVDRSAASNVTQSGNERFHPYGRAPADPSANASSAPQQSNHFGVQGSSTMPSFPSVETFANFQGQAQRYGIAPSDESYLYGAGPSYMQPAQDAGSSGNRHFTYQVPPYSGFGLPLDTTRTQQDWWPLSMALQNPVQPQLSTLHRAAPYDSQAPMHQAAMGLSAATQQGVVDPSAVMPQTSDEFDLVDQIDFGPIDWQQYRF